MEATMRTKIRPVLADSAQVDPASGGGGQGAVVGARVDPPQLGVGEVGELRAVVEADQAEQPEHDVAVGAGVGDDHLRPPAALLAVDEIDHVQRVPGRARDDHAGQADGLVVEEVQPRRAPAPTEVLRVGPGVDAADRDDEADPVDRRHQTATPGLRQPDVGLGLDEGGRWAVAKFSVRR